MFAKQQQIHSLLMNKVRAILIHFFLDDGSYSYLSSIREVVYSSVFSYAEFAVIGQMPYCNIGSCFLR